MLSNVSTWSSTCRVSSQLILIVTQAGGTLSKKRQGQNVCESTVITVREEKCQNCDPKGAFHLKKRLGNSCLGLDPPGGEIPELARWESSFPFEICNQLCQDN